MYSVFFALCLYKKNNHKNHGQEVYKLEGNYAKSFR